MTKESPVVSYECSHGLAQLRIDNPPVNALSQGVRQGILDALDQAAADGAAAIVISCVGRSFISGADIKEIGQPPREPQLPEVMARLEASAIPVVAVLHGHALGGGLEIALACHYRIAAAGTRLGLPELKLGIIPGAGGTQRLPRLIGLAPALDMITTSKPVTAEKALKLGLINAIIDGDPAKKDFVETAIHWTADHALSREQHPRISEIRMQPSDADLDALATARKRASRKPDVLAPRYLCDALEAAFTLPFADGLARERELFVECRDSPQSAAFRHLFFAERQAAKLPVKPANPVEKIASAAVIGGGTMGRGIAINLLDTGLPVTLLEVDEERVSMAQDALQKHYQASVSRGRMSDAQATERLARLSLVTDYEQLNTVDLAIEAVFEDMAVKSQVLKQLDAVCKPGAILASNTSYQDINQLAAVTKRPDAVVGMHYFSPANIMKLLEIVRGDATSPEVMQQVLDIGKACGKIPVISGVCYGFIGNRINRRLQQQAQFCLLEGATPAEVDAAMEAFGMAMGPLAVGDLAGLDIGYMARQALSDEEKGDPRTYWIPDNLVESGRLGQKSGQGYYRYKEADRKRSEDPEVSAVVEAASKHFGYERASLAPEEIVERLLLAVVNEAARLLTEGIAARPGDVDIVYVNGYGFPAHKGGVMYWAEGLGSQTVHDKLQHYWQKSGDESLKPAQALVELAASGRGLSDLGV
ncbi:MAG: 3-hydroxyacyl-CoA dehydrogenase NAD-binding domain-containing protein [Pseudomonadota bacterium]